MVRNANVPLPSKMKTPITDNEASSTYVPLCRDDLRTRQYDSRNKKNSRDSLSNLILTIANPCSLLPAAGEHEHKFRRGDACCR